MLYNGVWEKSNKDQATESSQEAGEEAGAGEKLNAGQMVGAEASWAAGRGGRAVLSSAGPEGKALRRLRARARACGKRRFVLNANQVGTFTCTPLVP